MICWYCKKWEKLSPKTYARMGAVADGSRNPLDMGLLRAAHEMGAEIVATTPAKTLKQMTKVMRKHGTAIRVEDLQASDGSRVTKEDETFFNWAAGHVVVEWGDHSLHAEGIH